MPVIVIEGPDESGKTTLAHALMHMIRPAPIFRRSPATFKNVEWDEGATELVNTLAEDSRLFVLDRCSEISEPIYGTIVRDSVREGSYIDQWYHWNRKVFLCITNPFRAIEFNHLDVTGRFVTEENHDHIYTAYGLMYQLFRYHMDVMVSSYWVDSPAGFFGNLIEWLANQDEGWDIENGKEFVNHDNDQALKHYIQAAAIFGSVNAEADLAYQADSLEGR